MGKIARTEFLQTFSRVKQSSLSALFLYDPRRPFGRSWVNVSSTLSSARDVRPEERGRYFLSHSVQGRAPSPLSASTQPAQAARAGRDCD